MADDITVREATIGDASGIARVHVETWQGAYRGQVPDEFLDALDIDRRRRGWEQLLEGNDPEWSGPVWVALSDDRVVGFVNCGMNRDGQDERVGEVYAIYVLPQHWDTGAGRALIECAVEWLRANYDEATLWVLDTNDRARRFYELGGWSADGATKDDDRGSFVLREVRYRIGLR